MSAAARPSYTPRRNHSSRLTVIVFVAVLFLVGRSVGAELKLGLHTLLLLRLHLPPWAASEAPVLRVSGVTVRVVVVRGGLGQRWHSTSRRPTAPQQPVSSQGYQNNNNNMDGLSSDFTSASPFIASSAVSWPRIAQLCWKHTGIVRPMSAFTRCTARFPQRTRVWRLTRALSSMFSVYLRGRGRGDVTSLLRENHAWSICFDCGLVAGILGREEETKS